MKRICFCLMFLFASSLAFGQGVFVPPQIALKTVNGITMPIPSATITVCAAGATGIPCSPPLLNAIFKDAALTQPLTNPFTTDASGNYSFAVTSGNYTVTVSASGFAGYSYQITAGTGQGNLIQYVGPNLSRGGVDLCDETNKAIASLLSAGGKIVLAAGIYNCSTPILVTTLLKFPCIEGAGPGTTLNWTPTSGTILTVNWGGGHFGCPLLRNVNITGTGSTNTVTAILGGITSITDDTLFENVGISGVNTAFNAGSAPGQGFDITLGPNFNIQNVTNGIVVPSNNTIVRWKESQATAFIVCAICMTGTAGQMWMSGDDCEPTLNNSVCVLLSGPSSVWGYGVHLEAPVGGQTGWRFIDGTSVGAHLFWSGGDMIDDTTTGTQADFIRFAGDTFEISGTTVSVLAGRTLTQVISFTQNFNSARVRLFNISNGTVPAAYTGTLPRYIDSCSFDLAGVWPGCSLTGVPFLLAEASSCPAGALAGFSTLCALASSHRLTLALGLGNAFNVPQVIATVSGTSAGTAIGAGASQNLAITATGAVVNDVAHCSTSTAYPASWQTGIQVLPPVVTANTITLTFSNPTTGGITPVAQAFNCLLVR